MLIIEVDHVHLQSTQRALGGRAHIIWFAVDPNKCPILLPDIAKLSGDNNLVAAIRNRFSNELFISTHSINIGGVEKRHAELDGAADGGDRFGFIAVPIKIAHAHATEPERGDEKPRSA